MGLIAFALELYFAISLGVSGLTKVDNPEYFETTLRQQGILPQWSLKIASRTLSFLEIIVAFLLVAGIMEVWVATLVLTLLVIFLGLKIFLLKTGRREDCGCYGSAKPQKIDGTSIAASAILVLVATVNLWLVTHAEPVSWSLRLIAGVFLAGMGSFLFGKIIRRHIMFRSSSNSIVDVANIGLAIGENAPSFVAIDQDGDIIKLDDSQGKRRLLAFVAPGCPACPGTLKALQEVMKHEKEIEVVVIGSSDYERNNAYVIEQNIKMPLLTPDADLVEKLYHVRSFPFVFVVDEVGAIRAKGIVNVTEHAWELLHGAF